MKKIYLILLLCLASITGAWAQAACAGIPSVPSQDCKFAIPLCGLRYTYPTGAICGDGEVDAEIPPNTCLGDERNTTWYVFKVRKSGLLKFSIIPLDALVPPDSGELDYDWALFKLPPGTVNTEAVCTQLNAASNNWVVSCNYSAKKGATGILDTVGMLPTNEQGAGGTKWNQPLLVNRDEVYVLAVDNFTGDDLLTGYTIRFRDTLDVRTADDQARGIADITPEADDPELDTVLRSANCISPGVLFSFNKEIICSSINDGDITIVNLANPSIVYTIDSLYAQNNCQGGSAQNWFINFSPVAIDTNYAIVIRDSIIDICGKVLISDTLRFKVNPFVRLESFVDNVRQDSVCSGKPIEVRAIPDEYLNARVGDFTYTWSVLDSATNTSTPLVSSDSMRVDSNIVTITRSFATPTTIFFIVEARGVTTTCSDRDTMFVRINPLPTAPIASPLAACFGEQITVGVTNPEDSVYYNYKWSSTVGRNNVPQEAIFQLLGDTLNRSTLGKDSLQRRGQHDVFRVQATYKTQFGGCEGTNQTINVYVGKYMRPYFTADSIIRPDKNGYFVLDTNTFYNQSYVQTRNTNRMVTERWDFGDSTIISQPAISESVNHTYLAPGQYRITLYMVDSLLPGVYCTKSFSKLVEFTASPWESGRRGEIGFLPNVVTPNNDGKNDYLEFVGIPVNGYQLEVYNRWGKKVFSENPYNNTWKPSNLDNGTYFFRLKRVATNLPASAKEEVKGWFEIIY